jgi:hypothetical protein
MSRSVVLFRILSLLACATRSLALTAAPPGQAMSPSFTESEARKLLSDSAWAKRAKLHSAMKTQTPLPPMETPGTQPGGLGSSGLGHGVVPPNSEQLAKRAEEGNRPLVPCTGWGIGNYGMSVPSITSEECKAAWRSVSASKSAGLPAGTVIILWESAEPIREAKTSLAIAQTADAKLQDSIIVSVIGHPLLREINPASSMKPMIRDSAVLLRNGKNSVSAVDVAFVEANDSIIRFYFPRQGTVQPGDKEMMFRFEIQDYVVEAKFTLKDMVFKGKPAL